MKTFYLLAFALTAFLRIGHSQIYQQYFDGADTLYNDDIWTWNPSIFIELDSSSENIWQIGAPQKQLFNMAATSPNVLITDTLHLYPTKNLSRFQFKIRAWSTFGILAVQWKQKLNIDTIGDGGIIEFSLDGGDNWQSALGNPNVYNFYGYQPQNVDTLPNGEIGFVGTDLQWRDVWLCYDMFWLYYYHQIFNQDFLIRFTFESDAIDGNNEGWMIDNLLVHVTIAHTIKTIKEDEDYIKVYPNPSADIVHIETQKIMAPHIIEEMVLINALGQEVRSWKNIPTKFFFYTQEFEEGSYFLKIRTNLKSETMPLVIKR